MNRKATIHVAHMRSKTARGCSCKLQTTLIRSNVKAMKQFQSFIFGAVRRIYGLIGFSIDDYYGQLGVGSEKVIHNLPKVCSFNIVVTDVSCGEEHTVFVQGDGGYVYAMGSNNEGKLGTGNPEMRSCNVPTLVDGISGIKKVACGTSHTLALSDDGQVYAWG